MNQLSKGSPFSKKVKFNPGGSSHKDYSNLVSIIMAGMWFAGFFMIFYYYPDTEISFVKLFVLFAFFALAATLIPYKFSSRVIPVDYWHVVALNIAGIGPLLTGIFLVVNFQFATNTHIYRYELEGFQHNKNSFRVNSVTLKLSGDNMSNHPDFKVVDYISNKENLLEADSVAIELSEGYFGYTVSNSISFY